MKLPVVSGKEVIKALFKKGYYLRDQKGSHVHLRHPTNRPITVPNHKVISRKTLKTIMNETGLTDEELR